MATVNYPELLPHPLVSDGYGFRSNQSQAVSLFDVETQSRDETRTVNVGFTFTDLQYKVFHGWFMNVLVHGQKWFNMRLDGEFYECTFGGVQPQYSLNRKIITVTATIKTRPSTGFVNYTNQRVSYPDAVNYMPSPFDPSGWFGAIYEGDDILQNQNTLNSSGNDFMGYCEQVGTDQFVLASTRIPDNSTPVIIGDKLWSVILIKKGSGHPPFIRFRFADQQGFRWNHYFNVFDEKFEPNSEENMLIDLGDQYLIGASFVWNREDSGAYTEIFMWSDFANTGTPSGAAPIGSNIYAQAAFSGKTGKYQGAISYNAVNYMPSPFDPEGWAGFADPDGTITNVTIENPSGETVVGLAEQTTTNFFTLEDSIDSSSVAGEKWYAALIVKPISGYAPAVRFRFSDSTGFLGDVIINSDSSGRSGGGVLPFGDTDLGDGYRLIQVEFEAPNTDPSLSSQFYLWTNDNTGIAPIGSQLYVQAAYFGKADDWPAIITPADPDQFPAAITYEY